ncbi:MAG: hypothetical protein ABJL99_12405 [Aliishimia sp.]
MRTLVTSVVCSALAAISLNVSSVAAQDAGSQLQLELNSAAVIEGGGCRLTYVATNQSDIPLSDTAYRVGVFDAGGVVSAILVLPFGALPSGKTRLVLFDLAGQACTDISRIVVDSSDACLLEDGSASDFCMTGLATASRTDIQFGL